MNVGDRVRLPFNGDATGIIVAGIVLEDLPDRSRCQWVVHLDSAFQCRVDLPGTDEGTLWLSYVVTHPNSVVDA